MNSGVEVNELPPRAKVMLQALRERAGSWISRPELARATRKKRLSPNDVMLLGRMVSMGLIEEQTRPTHLPVKQVYYYRLAEKG